MALRFPSRPKSDRVRARLTVGSCQRATDALVNAGCICCLYRMRLGPGVEREKVEALARELWTLGNWYGRLVEDEG